MFLAYAEVSRRTGLSRASIDRLIKADAFPKPVELMARRLGFVDAEVDAWERERIEKRDAELATRGGRVNGPNHELLAA